jgi:hypothetical protein
MRISIGTNTGYNECMALKHDSTKLCEYLIQATDGKFTFAGTFANLFAAELPLIRPIGVMVEFGGDPGDPFRVSLEGPEVNLLIGEGSIEVPPLRHPLEQWSNSIGGTAVIRFAQEGLYRVILRSGDVVVHEYPFAVLQVPQNPA